MSDEDKPPLENIVEFRRPDKQEGAPDRLPRKRNQPASQGGSGNKHVNAKNKGKQLYFGYRPGEHLHCKVVKPEPGGYAVVISRDNLPGFLPSQNKYKIGDELLTTFVSIDKNRVLLSEQSVNGQNPLPPQSTNKKIDSTPRSSGLRKKDVNDDFDDVD